MRLGVKGATARKSYALLAEASEGRQRGSRGCAAASSAEAASIGALPTCTTFNVIRTIAVAPDLRLDRGRERRTQESLAPRP